MPANLWADPVGYALLSSDKTTLTFYYDEQKDTRPSDGEIVYLLYGYGGNSTPGWLSSNSKITSVIFDSSFTDARPQSCGSWFSGFSNLETIDLQYLDTRDVTNMYHMFYNCKSLTSLDVSHFNTSNVTTMEEMFFSCSGLTSLDLGFFDTSNVTTMKKMFFDCKTLETLTFGNSFDTSKVMTMNAMFQDCIKLSSLDLSMFKTSQVTDMSYMFNGCQLLSELMLSNTFNTEKVTTMKYMFYYCQELTSLNLSSFNTSNVTTMQNMFCYCEKLESLDLTTFDTGKVTSMRNMFLSCYALSDLKLGVNFTTSNVTDMAQMFSCCHVLANLNLSGFNTEKVTSMNHLFSFCYSLTSLDISNFNTSSVTDMGNMFRRCDNLESLDLSSFNTAKVTNMDFMFYYCPKLQSITFGSNFITIANLSYNDLFSYSNAIKTIKIIVDENVPITKNIFSTASQFHPHLLVHTNSGVASNLIDNQVSFDSNYISWKGCLFASLNGRIVPPVNISISSGTYNGNPRTATLSNDIVSATFEYKLSSASDETYTTTAPTNVGAYTVKATTVGTETYFPITKTAPFSIYAASLSSATVTGSSVNADYGGSPSIGSLTVNYPAADYVIWYRRAGTDDATTIPEGSIGQYSVVLKPSDTGNLTGEKVTSYTVNVQLPVEFKQCEWVTYYDERFNLATPAGYQAYKVSGASSSGVTAEAIGYIPMGVPVILHTNKSGTSSESMTIRLNEQTSASEISGDAAYVGIPSTETSGVTPSGTAYILVGDQFVLYEGSAAIPAHRCYLSLTSEARKRSLGIDFGDGTTSLRELEGSEEWKEKREMWYTLDGRKLNTMPQKKGLYVRNGQKVVVK